MHDRLHLLAAILTQLWLPVASTKALNLLHWVMHVVLYRCTAAAIKMASKVGPFFVVVLFTVALAAAGAIWSK
jgi:hypothetical protein